MKTKKLKIIIYIYTSKYIYSIYIYLDVFNMFFYKYKKLEINLKTYINKIKNAIIKPNKPTASVKANPKIARYMSVESTMA